MPTRRPNEKTDIEAVGYKYGTPEKTGIKPLGEYPIQKGKDEGDHSAAPWFIGWANGRHVEKGTWRS